MLGQSEEWLEKSGEWFEKPEESLGNWRLFGGRKSRSKVEETIGMNYCCLLSSKTVV
jgi:hypothetical protein